MNPKQRAPMSARTAARDPAPAPASPPRRRRRRILWAAAIAAVAAGLAAMWFGGGGPPAAPSPPDWPAVTIDGVDLPVFVAATRSRREQLVPLPIDPDRQLARFFRRYAVPVGVLFVYPDTAFRSVHLDPVVRGGAVAIAFLTEAGEVDSVWSAGNPEFLALSRGRVRYTLFVPGGWFEAHPFREGSRITLPAAAVDAAARAEAENPPITDPPPARIRIGGVPLVVEIAARRDPRNRGLMFREHLADGTGMLFLFPEAAEQKFWMRNTRVPLDVAYIGEDLRIRNIVTMRPHDLDRDRKYGSKGPVILVLETPAGWFRRNGVREGARLEIPEALQALQRNADS